MMPSAGSVDHQKVKDDGLRVMDSAFIKKFPPGIHLLGVGEDGMLYAQCAYPECPIRYSASIVLLTVQQTCDTISINHAKHIKARHL